MSAPVTGNARWAGAFEPYGKGKKAAVGALLDAELRERLERYKRQVAKRYRVVEPDIIERVLPEKEELWIAPKLDGELWFLVKAGPDVALVAYNGRVLVDVSALEGVRERLADAPDLVIPGELVATPPGSERARSHHTGTALSDPRLERTLSFFAFDLAEDGGADALAWPFEKRWARLVELLGEGDRALPRCRLIAMHRGDPASVAKHYREWVVSERYEGVVVRSERGLTYKIKPTRTIDLVVIAYGERITGDVRQVRELQVGLMREDGTFQLVGSVGTGLSEDDRGRWHTRLAALDAKSSFRLANREGTLCRFVRPEIVVEVRVSDMLASDAWDAPIRRMALAYDGGTGWSAVAEMRTAVPLHPVFLRERTDKKVYVGSVGMTQIAPWLDDTQEETLRASTTRASVEIVRRAVFTKETKGQLAVRKYVVIRTHKEHEGSHPPYVVYFTDFSQGRKAPLDTALRTASDEAGADAHVSAWLEENVKRGWSEVEAQRRGAPPALAAAAPATPAAPAEPVAAASEEPPKKKRAPRKKEASTD